MLLCRSEKLTELFHCLLKKKTIPQEFKDAPTIHMRKRKGNPHVCDKHGGVSLLKIARKVLTKTNKSPELTSCKGWT